MEIKLDKYDITIKSDRIIGVIGNKKEKVIEKLLKRKKIVDSKIKTDGKHKSILYSIINSSGVRFNTSSVKKEINYYIKKYKIKDKEISDRVNKYIKVLRLPNDIIYRTIKSLSTSEKYKVYILIRTLIERDMYVFINGFKYLDNNNSKYLKELISILKNDNKFIVIFDDDINNIFYNTNDTLIINNKNIVLRDTFELFTDGDYIENNNDIPDLSYITFLAKKLGVKLSYHKDVRDIMKDIYKHVKVKK